MEIVVGGQAVVAHLVRRVDGLHHRAQQHLVERPLLGLSLQLRMKRVELERSVRGPPCTCKPATANRRRRPACFVGLGVKAVYRGQTWRVRNNVATASLAASMHSSI